MSLVESSLKPWSPELLSQALDMKIWPSGEMGRILLLSHPSHSASLRGFQMQRNILFLRNVSTTAELGWREARNHFSCSEIKWTATNICGDFHLHQTHD